MTKICLNSKCPNRFTSGKEEDKDVISIICPKCEKVLFVSENREKKSKKYIKISIYVLLFFTLAFSAFYYYDILSNKIYPEKNSPDSIVNKFITNLNDMKYRDAFELTENTAWYPYEVFKEKFSSWNNIKVNKISGKSYYSKYKADTILNTKYRAIINNKFSEYDYDFHLKKINDKWKIVRLYFPRDPEIDALKINEIPKASRDAIFLYFDLISKNKFKKAYLLTTYKNKEKFIEKCKQIQNLKFIKMDMNIENDEYNVMIQYTGKKEKLFYSENQIVKMKKTDYWRISNFEELQMNRR